MGKQICHSFLIWDAAATNEDACLNCTLSYRVTDRAPRSFRFADIKVKSCGNSVSPPAAVEHLTNVWT